MRQSPHRCVRKLAASLGILVLASACAPPAPSVESGGVYTLTVADSYPDGHPFADAGASVLMDKASELSGGRIRFDYFPAEQMGDAADLPSLIRSGVVDLASVAPAYVPAELPLSGVADLPGLVEDSCTGSLAVAHLMSEDGLLYREDFEPKGLRPLVVGMIPDYEVLTGSRAVRVPSDLRGLQLRSSGGTIDRAVEGFGAAPVGMPATDMYEAISRGTVDGTVLGPVSAEPYHLEEVTGNATVGARLGSFTMTYSISDSVWDELPPDLRDVLRRAGEQATRSLCTALQEGNAEGRQTMRDAGVKLHRISGSERDAWDKATAPIHRRWAADMAEIDRSGKAALRELKDELRRAERDSHDD
ncbi:TRAP-type C4-dicarboxylate transport system substrate-binding protein [Prauserella sediminis]|uniref:TRAP-type C4-dicarboxylate transport system substrate-binding protein n=1 Tax=Prauserella sediminis TaxID=577680 RepID=A0A839XLV1_9PSEU|nr:TRAP transporter substrate-binding protein DctP [Prauserella sediminis]MBB3661728.1 TRAP-type C4-dicarboxylate transport system substrate-binding protein [Prauserella sediminis]